MKGPGLTWFLAKRYIQEEDHSALDEEDWIERLECPGTGNPVEIASVSGMSRIHCYDADAGTCLVGMHPDAKAPLFSDWERKTKSEAKAIFQDFYSTKVIRMVGSIIAVENLAKMQIGSRVRVQIRSADGNTKEMLTIEGIMLGTGPSGEDEILCSDPVNSYDWDVEEVTIGRICGPALTQPAVPVLSISENLLRVESGNGSKLSGRKPVQIYSEAHDSYDSLHVVAVSEGTGPSGEDEVEVFPSVSGNYDPDTDTVVVGRITIPPEIF